MREKIYEIVDCPADRSILSRIYDIFILTAIILSIIPLCFKYVTTLFVLVDYITCVIFVIDYILRFITADYKMHKGKISFLIYPFTPLAIIDFISIIPTVNLVNYSFRLFKLFRVFKAFRLFKSLRYSKNLTLLSNVIKSQRRILLSIVVLAFIYILISALIMFNIEPDNFLSFLDAFYWATTALTTVGYGDIFPITDAGKIVSIISSFFGVAIIALPSGVITASLMKEINKK